MAGEGFRTWVPGEVITANNVQGYLMDQAVQVYDDAADRDAALIGFLSEGMVAYLKDTDSVEVYDGSAWVGLGGDAPIFTAGSAGQFLKSLGTAGVDWDDIPLPGAATPTTEGIVPGKNFPAVGTTGTAAFPSVAYGFNALESETTGAGNVAIGSRAGSAITSATSNVIVGTSAAMALTTGTTNVAVGHRALESATSGSGNVAVGSLAGSQAQGGSNTLVGDAAGALMTGDRNIVVGANSLSGAFSVGSNNTVVGTEVSIFNKIDGNNNTVIGYQAAPSTATVSNEITLGNSSIATIRAQVTSITSLSDERDKTNVEELQHGLEFVNQLRPVAFDWWQRKPDPITRPDGTVYEVDESTLKRGEPDIGFIAQDIIELEDELEQHDRLRLSYRNNPDALEVTQGRLIPILVKAIQELSAEVESLKSQLK